MQTRFKTTSLSTMKGLPFFAASEISTACMKLDTRLRGLAGVRRARVAEVPVEACTAAWLEQYHGANLTPLFGWSRLASLALSKPRSLKVVAQRTACYVALERTLSLLRHETISPACIRTLGGAAVARAGQDFRKRRIFTDADRAGTRIEFIEAKSILPQMDSILGVINDTDTSIPVSLRAIWVLAAFLSCHPFPDGNGRVARALFNLVLMKAHICDEYLVPLSALGLASNGFFEICLRRAQLQGQLDMLVKYIESVLPVVEGFYCSAALRGSRAAAETE